MLIAFSVGNYRSFKEQVTLSMLAADLVSKPADLDTNNTFVAKDAIQLLKSAAIYGANASGKSNLITAINFMRSFVLDSARNTRFRQPIGAEPFRLNTETEQQPSFFELLFIVQDVTYRYGFTVSAQRVEQEWLYHKPGAKEGYLFKRQGDLIEVNQRSFKEGLGLQERTRPNALFLSVAAQWNGKKASIISEWFEKITANYGIAVPNPSYLFPKRLANSQKKQDIIEFVKQLDLGIADIQIKQLPAQEIEITNKDGNSELHILEINPEIITMHDRFDREGRRVSTQEFNLFHHESQGTRRLFELAEPILNALHTGTLLLIDELDARLHPLLSSAIIRMFHSPENNPHHAQLIFTTQDTNLLGDKLFRRDQIWFVEKSRRGESTLYSLAEYRPRNDASYEKNYLAGRYGAIPFLGNLELIFGAEHVSTQEAQTGTSGQTD